MASPERWGRSLRIIHWTVAIGVLLNQFVLEEGELSHRWTGTCVVAVVLYRIYLGLRGKAVVPFRDWPLSRADLSHFLRHHFRRMNPPPSIRNPLASYVYLLIWFIILSLGTSGWMMSLDAFWGEEWLEDVHGVLAKGLLGLILAHLSGVIVDSLFFRRKTWSIVFTGKWDESSR